MAAVYLTIMLFLPDSSPIASAEIQTLQSLPVYFNASVFQFIAIEGQTISPETSTKTGTKFCATTSLNTDYSTARVSIRGQPATTSVNHTYIYTQIYHKIIQ
jgi:hypothetical protein